MGKAKNKAKNAARAVNNWVLRRPKFCCCLPARLGAGIVSFLSILLGGILTVGLWVIVGSDDFETDGTKAKYAVAGLIETFLLIASILGFIGVLTRKQLFVVIYAYFLYFHLILNFIVAIYLLWEVTHSANTDIVKACHDAIKNPQAQKQCTTLLNVTKGVYWAVAVIVLTVETYCAFVVTRYVHQLRTEKRDVRNSRLMQRESAFKAFHNRFTSTESGDGQELLLDEFNPYEHSSPSTAELQGKGYSDVKP